MKTDGIYIYIPYYPTQGHRAMNPHYSETIKKGTRGPGRGRAGITKQPTIFFFLLLRPYEVLQNERAIFIPPVPSLKTSLSAAPRGQKKKKKSTLTKTTIKTGTKKKEKRNASKTYEKKRRKKRHPAKKKKDKKNKNKKAPNQKRSHIRRPHSSLHYKYMQHCFCDTVQHDVQQAANLGSHLGTTFISCYTSTYPLGCSVAPGGSSRCTNRQHHACIMHGTDLTYSTSTMARGTPTASPGTVPGTIPGTVPITALKRRNKKNMVDSSENMPGDCSTSQHPQNSLPPSPVHHQEKAYPRYVHSLATHRNNH